MRLVTRIYIDGRTKPHYDEYKTDCFDEASLRDSLEDLESFALNALSELEDLDDDIVDRVAL